MITAEECEVEENGRLIDLFGDDISDDCWTFCPCCKSPVPEEM